MSRMYQESIHEGYLTKSPPKMNRKWQRRYFVLLPHQKLIYFSKYNGKQKGIIDLDRVHEILFDLYQDKALSNVMSLEVKGQHDDPSRAHGAPDRIYYLLADSREEMEVWHKHLMKEADQQICRNNNGIDFHLHLLSYPGSGLPDPGCLAVDIWDSAGQERFRSISTSYFKNISGVLLVFDLSNRKSFMNLESWIDYVHEHTTEDSFVLQLVGNKCDLERQVSLEEVSLFCSNKQLSYVETSSTDSEQTNQLFHRLGEEIIKKGYYKGVPGDRSPPSRSLSVSSSVPLTTPRASCCGLRRHPTNP